MNVILNYPFSQAPEYTTQSFGRQLGIEKLEGIGGEVNISEVAHEIEIINTGSSIKFMYFDLMLGFIDYKIDDCIASLEFIGNINMNGNDAELYGVSHKGLESLEDEYIRIEGLGKFMLKEFINFLRVNEREVNIVNAEIDNSRVIELFTKLKFDKIISDHHEDVETDKNGFSRKYLQAYI